MFEEIVLPKNNEKEFIEIAKKLGTKKLTFLYSPQEYNSKKFQDDDIEIKTGTIANQDNINQASKLTDWVVAKSSDQDRQLLEGSKIKMIYGFEQSPLKDRMHQTISGLNHILCEIAKKNIISIGFSYSFLENPTIIGRMMQNIELCRKYKVKMIFASFAKDPMHLRQAHDVNSLFRLLGV